jgi:hypothetical protein
MPSLRVIVFGKFGYIEQEGSDILLDSNSKLSLHKLELSI